MPLLTLEETWNDLLPVLNAMFEETFDDVNYEKLGKIIDPIVQSYCSVRGADLKKLKKLEKALTEEIKKKNPTHPVIFTTGSRRWRLYLQLEDFFTSFCKSLIKKSAFLADEVLLKFIILEWKKYVSKQRILNWAFGSIGEDNRNENSRIYEIGVLALISWKETLFEEYNSKIVKTAAELLNRERQGETIDSTLISELGKCYLALGIHVDGRNDSMCVYKNDLERVILKETETFYVTYSMTFLKYHSVMEYLEEIEKIFRVEKQRVGVYFHSSTKELFMKTLNRSLIENHWELFYSEFKKCLILEKYFDISRMYWTFSMHMEDLTVFAKIFEEHVVGQGLTYIEDCGEDVKTDPKIYTEAILMIYKKYLSMVKYAFSSNKYLMAALQNATKQFVNKNFVTFPPNSARKTSQLVCKYYDVLMRKKLLALNTVCETPKLVVPSFIEVVKNENYTSQDKELTNALNEVLIVHEFIEDKDVFQEYHLQLLTKRLINDILNKGIDFESIMTNQMKSFTDMRYIKKFEKMIEDIKLSIALNQEFATAHREPLQVEFTVKVLQAGSWPFEVTPPHTLPLELEQCVAQFSRFHSEIYPKKRLCWLYNLSKGEIITNIFKNCYTIHASTMQISVLLLFNNSTFWTLGEIQQQTAISMDMILEIIAIFLKIKLFTCKNAELTQHSMISLNESYNNKKRSIKIDVPLKSEMNQEHKTIDGNIDKARIIALEATIVKIMKSRKTMKKVDLISKTLQDLTLQFKPDIDTIEKCTDMLIEKEYIQRSLTEASTFIYLA